MPEMSFRQLVHEHAAHVLLDLEHSVEGLSTHGIDLESVEAGHEARPKLSLYFSIVEIEGAEALEEVEHLFLYHDWALRPAVALRYAVAGCIFLILLGHNCDGLLGWPPVATLDPALEWLVLNLERLWVDIFSVVDSVESNLIEHVLFALNDVLDTGITLSRERMDRKNGWLLRVSVDLAWLRHDVPRRPAEGAHLCACQVRLEPVLTDQAALAVVDGNEC